MLLCFNVGICRLLCANFAPLCRSWVSTSVSSLWWPSHWTGNLILTLNLTRLISLLIGCLGIQLGRFRKILATFLEAASKSKKSHQYAWMPACPRISINKSRVIKLIRTLSSAWQLRPNGTNYHLFTHAVHVLHRPHVHVLDIQKHSFFGAQ